MQSQQVNLSAKKADSETVNLVDLPDSVLELITVNVAEKKKDELPILALPLAATCKKFRKCVSSMLIDDEVWINKYRKRHSYCEVTNCDLLSDDSQECLFFNPTEPWCIEKPCAYVHSRLAWYHLAGHNLQNLNLGALFTSIPTREAVKLMNEIAISRACIKSLSLSSFVNMDPEKVISFRETFVQLAPVIAPHLQFLSLDTRYFFLFKVLSLHDIPTIQTVNVHLHLKYQNHSLSQAYNILSFFAKLETVVLNMKVWNCERNTGELSSLFRHAKTLNSVSINSSITREFIFPQLNNFHVFVKKIVFSHVTFENESLMNLGIFASNNDHLQEIYFEYCSISIISLALSLETNEMGFGSKIRSLTFLDVTDSYPYKILSAIWRYCPNLISLSELVCSSPCWIVSHFLPRFKNLRKIECTKLLVTRHDPPSTNKLLNAAFETNSSIRVIEMRDFLIHPQQVCNLLHAFKKSIRSFLLMMSRSSMMAEVLAELFSVRNYLDVFKYVNEVRRDMKQLRFVSLPIRSVNSEEYNELIEEAKRLVASIKSKHHFQAEFVNIDREVINL